MVAASARTPAPALPKTRYDSVAQIIHWLTALAIIALLAIGLTMTNLPRTELMLQFKLFQLHKSLGITVLALSLFRLGWRIAHRPPPLPADMPALERLAAHGSHLLFYFLIIGMPLTGWAAVSASPFNLPTVLYGVLPWPDLPILSTLHDKQPVEAFFSQIHSLAAWILMGLLAVHVAAALRHHFIKRDDILRRMLPKIG